MAENTVSINFNNIELAILIFGTWSYVQSELAGNLTMSRIALELYERLRNADRELHFGTKSSDRVNR